jgi:hypothetical protein
MFQNIPGAQSDSVGGKLYAFGSFELGINAKGSLFVLFSHFAECGQYSMDLCRVVEVVCSSVMWLAVFESIGQLRFLIIVNWNIFSAETFFFLLLRPAVHSSIYVRYMIIST